MVIMMTLPNKILTRLVNYTNAILNRIDSKILNHNQDNLAHSSIFNNYVSKTNASEHEHGYITKDGKLTRATANVGNIVVTDSTSNDLNVVSVLPLNKVTHQDISSKLDIQQNSQDYGKILRIGQNGAIEPYEIQIPDSISYVSNLSDGRNIGTLKIGQTNHQLYCDINTDTTYAAGTDLTLGQNNTFNHNTSGVSNSSGLKLKKIDYNDRGHITNAQDITAQDIANLNVKITDTTYTAGAGLNLTNNNQFKHSNSIEAQNSTVLKKIKYDAQGHITGVADVEKADIVNLGIPSSDTTYTAEKGISITNNKIGHSNSNISPQNSFVFKKIKYNEYGHITGSSDVEASDLPNHTHEHGDLPASTGTINYWLKNGNGAAASNCQGTLFKQGNIVIMHLELYSAEAHRTKYYFGYVDEGGIPAEFRPSARFYHTFANNIDDRNGTIRVDTDGSIWARTSTSGQNIGAIFNVVYYV